MRPRLLLATLVATLALAGPARAEGDGERRVPGPKIGLVGLGAGLRLIPQTALFEDSAKAGHVFASRQPGAPAAILPLSYRVDREWSAAVEFGYGYDHYAFTDQTSIELHTVTLLIRGERSFDVGVPWFEPYLCFGAGYYLSTAVVDPGEATPRSGEAHATGLFLGLGARLALTADLGLFLEDRFALATTGIAGYGPLAVGGNLAALGFYHAWRN